MPDDLLRPTISSRVDPSVRPWPLVSQTYVAFFGGVIASTIVTFVNARRLGVDAAKRRLILLTGIVGLVGVVVVFTLLDGPSAATSTLRVSTRLVAVLCCLVQLHLQRSMDRAFQLRGTDYASLWAPGVAAVICGAVSEALILLLAGSVL